MNQTELNFFRSLCSITNVYGKPKSAYEIFVDSTILASMVGLKDSEILQTKEDIDNYFLKD